MLLPRKTTWGILAACFLALLMGMEAKAYWQGDYQLQVDEDLYNTFSDAQMGMTWEFEATTTIEYLTVVISGSCSGVGYPKFCLKDTSECTAELPDIAIDVGSPEEYTITLDKEVYPRLTTNPPYRARFVCGSGLIRYWGIAPSDNIWQTPHASYKATNTHGLIANTASVLDGQPAYWMQTTDYEWTAPTAGDKLSWDFPRDGFEISNDEWSDWSLWYDMDAADIGEVGNILLIVSQVSTGISYDDWEFVATTTDLTQWTVNRGDEYPDGTVYSKAKLIKVDDPGGCDTGMETDCAWTTIAETDVITWTSSSTGYTIFDNPYDRPADFYPASTTAEEEEEGGFWNALFGRLSNVFPLSLAKQIYLAFKNATRDQGITPVLITLQDLTGPAADNILGGTDPVMLSAQLLEDNSDLWADYIFPFFEACVYLIGFFLTLFILFPKFRSLDFGGHQKVPGPDPVGTIYNGKTIRSTRDIRPAKVGHTADLRYKYPKGVTDLRFK